jgi:D-aminoacyl-tRNA deacylase
MKAVIQRVLKASVTVADEMVGSIEHGLCVLVGIARDDTEKDMEYIIKKILTVRLFENDETDSATSGGKWNKSVVDKNFEILCVSQFTLQSTLKGTKPDFHYAMSSDQSKEFYEKFLANLKKMYKQDKIKDGRFGAYMQVNIQNDGPVTLLLDSSKSLKSNKTADDDQ